ncbi:YafY family protein [Saccharibacillus sp. JS10]|uniref:helix-turn-helix transcriptional regulator n=1 Tax=Saccharibacillus sp. JS10 TaxID=2950552 RepID=UPI00210944B4|nr:YafY family protein [Saccharibacillus sp. JS10]MCQ4088462.1 YafY family transcriptional regulator [Saccharibacillus sp. JS10]
MKKAERLNAMQRYAYRKRRFTLRELMDEFQISRSTALRHIQSLEELGLPLFAEQGRYGGYRVLETASLPPVSFTTNEVLSLYLAIQTLRGLSGDLFRGLFASIDTKFLDVVSETQRQQIERIQNRISLYPNETADPGEHLESLLQAAVESRVLQIRYVSGKGTRNAIDSASLPLRLIQPFAVYASQGFWYCRAYDLDKREYRVFRCDRIIYTEASSEPPIEDLLMYDLHTAQNLRQPSPEATFFTCYVAPDCAEQLRLQLYPSMMLAKESDSHHNGWFQLSGSYEPQEIEFICSFLSRFGSWIKITEPLALKEQLRAYYMRLIAEL